MPSVHPGSGMIAATVPETITLSVDDLANIPPPFSPVEISVASQEVTDAVTEFSCDPMDISVEQAAKTAKYPAEGKNSMAVDDNNEITIHCTMAGSVRTLMVKPNDSIGSLKSLLAKSFECAATEIHIIFKGRIISCDPKCSLCACGLKSDSKLQILKRPISRAWFQLKVHFPVTGQSPMSFRMHSSSTTLNVKKQLQELIGCPHNDVCLFLADGLLMNDDVSLRDYNVQGLEDIYCIINPSSTSQDVVIPLGERAPFVSIKLSAEKLMEHIVRNQALRDRAAKCPESRKLKNVDAKSDDISLRKVAGNSDSDECSARLNSVSDEPSAKRRETFLGMRKGFLFAGKSRSKTKLDRGSAPSVTPELSSLPTDPVSSVAEDLEGERPRDSVSAAASERARKAGIPENLRTGRASTAASADGALAQLQKLLKDVLTPGSESTAAFSAVANEAPLIFPQESEPPKQTFPVEQAQKRSGRCAACRAKVGLTAITCRCGGTFCARHRYAEAHLCQFDYKSLQRSSLQALYQPVVAPKLEERI
eukprot:CAMPEP_0172177974 /NCGR_PEP_ID=MMETSP1050-20130122/15759_1 /TAXON_ID=233186 /ORGANISM="Cryptomonas curvata, Strain CCAP979/52" /LENGTH=535 /DNA_ID=CAMNT_0012850603 /DNA_START=22 /DNA_END=1629 /DNA_ORIENTATION=+